MSALASFSWATEPSPKAGKLRSPKSRKFANSSSGPVTMGDQCGVGFWFMIPPRNFSPPTSFVHLRGWRDFAIADANALRDLKTGSRSPSFSFYCLFLLVSCFVNCVRLFPSPFSHEATIWGVRKYGEGLLAAERSPDLAFRVGEREREEWTARGNRRCRVWQGPTRRERFTERGGGRGGMLLVR